MSREELLKEIKRTVRSFDADADVILYGSRARGDAQSSSDWDLLVLLSRSLSWRDKEPIMDALYDLELREGEVLVPIILTREEWRMPRRQGTPLFEHVKSEGVPL